jgi:hypothetical protein
MSSAMNGVVTNGPGFRSGIKTQNNDLGKFISM